MIHGPINAFDLQNIFSVYTGETKCNFDPASYCFYLAEIGIKSVLSFITGSPLMPKKIHIQFLPEDSKNFSLPDPDTFTRSLKIPTCHTTYEKFQSAFDATVRVQGKGYGRA